MVGVAVWVVGAAVAWGLVVGVFWLLGRRGRGLRAMGYGHGVVGVLGAGLAVYGAGGAAVAMGGMLLGAVGGGLVVAWAHVRGRRAAGMAVVLHATFGVAGLLLLLVYAAGRSSGLLMWTVMPPLKGSVLSMW